jgi:hypothetical protein
VRQRVDADELDALATRRLGREPRTVRARIVVRIDDVDLRVGRERRVHLLAGVGLEPLHVGGENDLRCAAVPQPLEKAVVTIARGRRRHEPLELDDLSGGADRLADPLARFATDLLVVAADEGRELLPVDLTIEDDHGDALLERLGDGFRERRRFLGADDEEVDALRHELTDLRALRQRIVLRVLEDELEVGVRLRRRREVLVHLHAPRLAEVALADADDPRVLLGARVPGRRRLLLARDQQHDGPREENGCEQAEESLSSHGACIPNAPAPRTETKRRATDAAGRAPRRR